MPQAFKLNSTRATTREYLFDIPWLLAPIVLPICWLLKLLRIRLPASVDDPPVDSLSSFTVDEANLPEEIRSAFAGDLEYLRGEGFDIAVFHRIVLPHIETTIHRATLADQSGIVARLQRRYWAKQNTTHDIRQFETGFRDGGRVVTLAGKPDMLMPESWDVLRRKPCPIGELHQQHRERLETAADGGRLFIRDEEELLEFIEREHQELTSFHLERGAFEPGPELETPEADSSPAQTDIATGDAAVLEELDKLGKNQASWSSVGWGLALSLIAFAAVFAARQDFRMLWMLVPILLVHEAGHWVAMNAFGYKNMRMFFIPFFGAAVSGRNLNVSGWKKAAVALMGPVPSILASIAITVVGIRYDLAWAIELSLLSLIVNLFNLLPILPLDGGQMLQAVLFCRSRFLDVAARVVAVLALLTLSAAVDGWLLMGLAIMMAVAIPLSYRLAKTTEELRDEEELSTRSPDGATVPRETALAIMHRLQAGTKANVPPKILAQHTLSVFENLNAKPPGALATIGLLGVYGFSIVIGLVGIGVVALAQTGNLDRIVQMGRMGGDLDRMIDLVNRAPQTPLTCGEAVHIPSDAAEPLADRTLMIHAPDPATALADFKELSTRFPGSDLVRFGSTLFFTPLEGAADKFNPLFTELEDRGRRVQVVRGVEFISVDLQVTAPLQEATFIESEIAAFAEIPPWLRPLPPWSEEWITSPQVDHWRKMRNVLKQALSIQADQDSEQMAVLLEEGDEAFRLRDEARLTEIHAEIARLRKESIRIKMAKLALEYDDPDSQRVIDAALPYLSEFYDSTAELDERNDEDPPLTPGEKSLFEIRELLGVRPSDMIPSPAKFQRHTTASVMREGGVLDLFIQTPRPGDGLVEFSRWLCDHGCTGLRYDILGLTNDLGLEGGLGE